MTAASSWHPGDLTGLDASAAALNRTVDALGADDLAGPSGLPGWSRAHVVAHVALNGEALAGSLSGLARGERVAMYASDEARDADIATLTDLAASDPGLLRDRLLAATTAFADAVRAMDDETWAGSLDRVPSGVVWPAATVVPTRRREVEIHHADLDTAYGPGDWPDDFCVELIDALAADHASSGPFRVRATDLGLDWTVGDVPDGTAGAADLETVMGTAHDLGWWLTGRGTGDAAARGLATDAGRLPSLGPWRRASVTADPTQER